MITRSILPGLCLLAFSLSSQAQGVVSSGSPEATAAGIEILEAGGNAIDAAVAVQFALAVTEPAMSGLGGQTQIILMRPGNDPVVINGTSFAPSNIPAAPTAEQIRTGWTATTVPSTVRVLDFALSEFGSGMVGWADTLAPAIRYAEDGYVVGNFRAKVYARHADDLRGSETAAPLFLLPDSAIPAEGDVIRQPVLAGTLRRLAQAGAEDFYSGEIASIIASDMKAHGGWITFEDLASTPEPKVSAPLSTQYRGYEVHTLPPPAGGWVMLQAVNLLALDESNRLSQEGSERALALLRALAIAHRSRQDMPETDLEAYADDMADRIGPQRAEALFKQRLEWEKASERQRSGFEDGVIQVRDPVSSYGETTHFSVVDKNGMAVSVTASIDSYFGALVASPQLGFLYNNYLQSLKLEPGHTFSLRPRVPPYSSMSAAIVSKDNEPRIVLGSPGSSRIISAVAQVTSHWIDVSKGIDAAVSAPRVHVGVRDPSLPDLAYIERMPPGLDVGKAGFQLAEPATDLVTDDGLNAYWGGVHAIALEEGGWRGAADPRRDGTVGYQDE